MAWTDFRSLFQQWECPAQRDRRTCDAQTSGHVRALSRVSVHSCQIFRVIRARSLLWQRKPNSIVHALQARAVQLYTVVKEFRYKSLGYLTNIAMMQLIQINVCMVRRRIGHIRILDTCQTDAGHFLTRSTSNKAYAIGRQAGKQERPTRPETGAAVEPKAADPCPQFATRRPTQTAALPAQPRLSQTADRCPSETNLLRWTMLSLSITRRADRSLASLQWRHIGLVAGEKLSQHRPDVQNTMKAIWPSCCSLIASSCFVIAFLQLPPPISSRAQILILKRAGLCMRHQLLFTRPFARAITRASILGCFMPRRVGQGSRFLRIRWVGESLLRPSLNEEDLQGLWRSFDKARPLHATCFLLI